MKTNMCTEEQIKLMVIQAFEEEGGIKDQMLDDYRAENNRTILKITGIFGITLISSIIGFTAYLTTLSNTVSNHEKFLNSNQVFTQADGELLKLQIQNNSKTLSSVATSKEIDELKETMIRLDERLRNKGI